MINKDKDRYDKIHITKDYDIFNRFVGNRYVTSPKGERRVKQLMESFKEKYLPIPILVNKQGKIIDGHNRLEALRRLKMPVRYIISKVEADAKDIQRINNVNNKWDTEDYLASNLDIEKDLYPDNFHTKPYHMFLLFKKKYKFAHRNNLMMLMGINYSNKEVEDEFKHGGFTIKSWEKALSAADYINSFRDLIPHINYRERAFVTAFLQVMNHHKFNRKRWIEKLSQNSRRLVSCQRTSEYKEVILEIYNYKCTKTYRIVIKDAA
jgi:hypothetical protein